MIAAAYRPAHGGRPDPRGKWLVVCRGHGTTHVVERFHTAADATAEARQRKADFGALGFSYAVYEEPPHPI